MGATEGNSHLWADFEIPTSCKKNKNGSYSIQYELQPIPSSAIVPFTLESVL